MNGNRSIRGAVIVETAFVMSVVLMVIFGALQLALLAYTQTSQDGAAFVAARAYAGNPAAGTASAAAAAHKIFAHVPVSALTLTASTGQVLVGVLGTGAGLPVPGSPSSFGLNSAATEIVPTASTGTSFATTATLSTYVSTPGDYPYMTAGLHQTYPLGVAEIFGAASGSLYAEWYCRSAAYSALRIPTTTSGAANNCYFFYTGHCWFDPMEDWSPLDPIYDWDSGRVADGQCSV